MLTSMHQESKNNKNTLSNRSHYSSVQFNQKNVNRPGRGIVSPIAKKNLGTSHFSSLGMSKSMDLLLIKNERSQSR